MIFPHEKNMNFGQKAECYELIYIPKICTEALTPQCDYSWREKGKRDIIKMK